MIDEEAVANASELFDIKAYPNPFVNQITLSLANENVKSEIMVYDMTGKRIQQVSTEQTTLEIGNDWSHGVYLVQIVQGQETKNIRIVKQ
uniref:T9SS type A sorting domain-containing protein n=1 Tax=Flavobacterium sp. TaxID=239 RepID=UPI00404903BE